MRTIFFSGVVTPTTEQRIELVERVVEINPAPLKIDVSHLDPTLTIFHEVKSKDRREVKKK